MKNRIEKDIARLKALPDESIDTRDIPEVDDWRHAERGKFFRPIKKSVTIRLDADVLEWFKNSSSKYQTKVNHVLREYMEAHQ